jgi:hypothetical protein
LEVEELENDVKSPSEQLEGNVTDNLYSKCLAKIHATSIGSQATAPVAAIVEVPVKN